MCLEAQADKTSCAKHRPQRATMFSLRAKGHALSKTCTYAWKFGFRLRFCIGSVAFLFHCQWKNQDDIQEMDACDPCFCQNCAINGCPGGSGSSSKWTISSTRPTTRDYFSDDLSGFWVLYYDILWGCRVSLDQNLFIVSVTVDFFTPCIYAMVNQNSLRFCCLNPFVPLSPYHFTLFPPLSLHT